MPQPSRRLFTLALGVGLAMGAADTSPDEAKARPLDAATVARRPAPGTVVPGGIEYVPGGKAVTYLKSETGSLDRVLWRAEVGGGPPRVVARPPGRGETDASVSPEEALRRERMRLVDTGITRAVRAAKADITVYPLNGDLYLQRGTGPLERITETPTPDLDPQLSPDGSKVAFVREGVLIARDLATKAETRLSAAPVEGTSFGLAEFMAQEEMDRFHGFWWSPDGSRIAYQETDERPVALYTIVHDGADAPSVETHRYPFAGAANAIVKLGVVSATGGETRWIDFAERGVEHYLARVDWESPESILVQRLARDQKTLRLVRVEAETGRVNTVLEESSPTWVNLNHDLRVIPAEAGGGFVWASERSGFKHLELRDRDGKLVRPLTSGDWLVDSVAARDPARREVWFGSGKDDPLGAKVYRVSLDGGEPAVVTPEAGTHAAVVASDGSTFVDTFSHSKQPPITRLRSRSGEVLATLDDSSADPRLREFDLAPPEYHEFKGRDGVSLRGAFYPPRSTDLGRPAPLIVMLYGGPHVQYVTDAWGMTADLRAQYLTQLGFAVWKMDNRGSARRGHAFEAALHRDFGSVEVRDQVDGVAFIAAKHPDLVDSKRVGVNGRSYGGYMTLRCLTEAPEVFHAGVAEAPVTTFAGYDTCYTERYMGTPADNPDGYERSSVLGRVDRLKGDLLIMHGLIDENVHFRHTARLVSALVAADKPFQVLPMPEERHSSRRPASRTREVDRLVAFFRASLAPGRGR